MPSDSGSSSSGGPAAQQMQRVREMLVGLRGPTLGAREVAQREMRQREIGLRDTPPAAMRRAPTAAHPSPAGSSHAGSERQSRSCPRQSTVHWRPMRRHAALGWPGHGSAGKLPRVSAPAGSLPARPAQPAQALRNRRGLRDRLQHTAAVYRRSQNRGRSVGCRGSGRVECRNALRHCIRRRQPNRRTSLLGPALPVQDGAREIHGSEAREQGLRAFAGADRQPAAFHQGTV